MLSWCYCVKLTLTNLDSILKSRDITLSTKIHHGFYSSHVWMWELDYKESWALKNWCFWTVVLEKTLESPLDCNEIQPVHPKGDQSWVFIGRTDVEAETPILWPPDTKSWLIWKDPDAGKDWGQDEKGTPEDEMIGWHYRLNGHGFGWTLGVGDRQGGLACCSPWSHRESDMNEWLNWTEDIYKVEWWAMASSGHIYKDQVVVLWIGQELSSSYINQLFLGGQKLGCKQSQSSEYQPQDAKYLRSLC